MTTYYVDFTGGLDGNSGTSVGAAWKTVNKVNTTSLVAGDIVLFKQGELWRETLVPPSNGSAGNPITFDAYGSGEKPIFCGADITALSWTLLGGNVWRASRTTDPGVVRVTGIVGTEKSSQGALAANNDWYWDGSTFIFLYSTVNPTAKTIEISARPYSVAIVKNYIVLQNVIAEMSSGLGNIVIGTASNNVTIKFCEARYSDFAGILVNNDASAPHLIQDNTAHHCSHGILGYIHTAAASGSEVVVRENECYNNVFAGIMCRANWWIIDKNKVHHNGDTTLQAVGIWVISGSLAEGTGDHNIIRYNNCYNQTGTSWDGGGIALDQWCDNNDIYSNVCYANRSYGIEVLDVKFCNIYNNTCYGNETEAGMFSGEITINSNAAPNNRTSDLVVKNNIGYATQASSVAVYIDANTTGNANIIFDKNIWFSTSTNWWTAGASNGTSLATWNANSFVGTDQNVDPKFVNAAANSLWTVNTSPAALAGDATLFAANLLDWTSTWPFGVVLDDNSTRKDIGAYQVRAVNLSATLAAAGKLGASANAYKIIAQAATLAAAGALAATAFQISQARATLGPGATLSANITGGTSSSGAILSAAGGLFANAFRLPIIASVPTLAAAGRLVASASTLRAPPYVGIVANKGTDIMEMVTTNYNADIEMIVPPNALVGNSTSQPGSEVINVASPLLLTDGELRMRPASYLFADLPSNAVVGDMAQVTNSAVNTMGAIVTGGGSFRVLAWFNGTNWTVIGV